MCLAIPGRLIAIQGDGDLRVGEVDFGGVSRDANLAFVPEAAVGDYVLVHVGFAIALIDEAVAKETLQALTLFEALTDEAVAKETLEALTLFEALTDAEDPGQVRISRGGER